MKFWRAWIPKILPSPAKSIQGGKEVKGSYRRFARGLSAILLLLALTPLTLISVLSHYQYEKLLQKEEMDQLVLNLDEAKNRLEEFISKLQSMATFVASSSHYDALQNPVGLEKLFTALQKEYPEVTDIEIIDNSGKQKAYVGPYNLKEFNHSWQRWYEEVTKHGVYISTVFSGFRDVPHFVVAVRMDYGHQKDNGVLRVTIEGNTLQRFVDGLSTSYADDIFLIDENYVNQTRPRKYGKFGSQCLFYDLGISTKRSLKKIIREHDVISEEADQLLVNQKYVDGKNVIQAITELDNGPWRVVMIKEQYIYEESWQSFKKRLLIISIICVIVSVIVTLEISASIANHLRESRKQWLAVRDKAEESAKLASLGRLAAGVAHEINNPLAIINQKAGLVQDFMEMTGEIDHKEAMEEALNGVQSSVERCKKITHRLLGFARHTDVMADEIDINTSLREIIDFLAKEAAYNQIQIAFELDADLQKISSDKNRLQQVFLNITNNAIDAVGSHGQVTLSSKQLDKDHIQVSITDNGPGIPPEVKKRIFDPFFTTKETGKGTGLGLSIAYGIIQKLGGTIKVQSEVGKGTRFEIELPVEPPHE